MSDHRNEDERVAAFLDRRMDPRGRDEAMAHFLDHDEDREVLAGTASILRQLEEAEAVAPPEEGVVSLDAAKRERGARTEGWVMHSRLLRWLAFAAVLAGIALVGRVLRSWPSPYAPLRLAARHGDRGLPDNWSTPGSNVRGPEVLKSTATQRDTIAWSVRAGAMLVDLSVAVQARDTARTDTLATQLHARLVPPPGGPRGPLRQIADSAALPPERLLPRVRQATARIERRVGSEALQLGAWIEAARLAAERRDAAFFRDDAGMRKMLDRAVRLTADDQAVRAAAHDVRRLTQADPPPWAALAPALEELARAATDR